MQYEPEKSTTKAFTKCFTLTHKKHVIDKLVIHTSIPDPTLGANGNMANPGTKNTGNHLVNKAVPGPNAVKMDWPEPGTTRSATNKAKNKTTHPANCAGKEMPLVTKTFLTPRSTRAMATAPEMASRGMDNPELLLEEAEAEAFFLLGVATFLGAGLVLTAAPPRGLTVATADGRGGVTPRTLVVEKIKINNRVVTVRTVRFREQNDGIFQENQVQSRFRKQDMARSFSILQWKLLVG